MVFYCQKELTAMRLNTNQQETLMYQSRLLFQHDEYELAHTRSLVFTIYTNKVSDTEHFKRAVYQKVHRALYKTLSTPDRFTFSMMIAADVEGSRSGVVRLETVRNAEEPHYHGVMVFSESDWTTIEMDLSLHIARIKSAISDIREVKSSLIDSDGVCRWDTIWIKPFENNNRPVFRFSTPFSNYINYIFKTDHHAQRHGLVTYMPSVFPHDLYPPKDKHSSAEPLFEDLCAIEEMFQKSRQRTVLR